MLETGAAPQEYFVYFKGMQRISGKKDPFWRWVRLVVWFPKSAVPPEFAAGCCALLAYNGATRRSISAPLLKGAFSPFPTEARTNRLFSEPGFRGYSSLSTQCSHFSIECGKCQEKPSQWSFRQDFIVLYASIRIWIDFQKLRR